MKKGTVTEEGQRRISILGSDFALDETSDIKRLLRCNDYQIKESPVCESWEDYLSLSDCRMMLNCYPSGKAGTEWAAERLGRPFMYLPSCFDYDEITGQLEALSESMELLGVLDYEGEKRAVKQHFRGTSGSWRLADRHRRDVSSETYGIGKTFDLPWLLCRTDLSGCHQP